MKKLTLIAAVIFTAATSFAQTTAAPSKDKKANHGQTVSAAAQTSVSAEGSVDAASKGEYVSEIARSKKDAASKEGRELAKETKEAAQDRKEQAKQLKQEQKEAAKAKGQEIGDAEASLSSTTQATQSTSIEDGSLATEGTLAGSLFATTQGKGQEKPKADKKETPKEKPADKAKKELDNHGQKVKAAAQEIGEGSREKGQEVKEVASAKRQQKPEKVEAGAEVDVTVKAPKSAARPGRGAAKAVKGTTTAATKTVGNAAKAVKPVKVGGNVGVGSVIKVGKN